MISTPNRTFFARLNTLCDVAGCPANLIHVPMQDIHCVLQLTKRHIPMNSLSFREKSILSAVFNQNFQFFQKTAGKVFSLIFGQLALFSAVDFSAAKHPMILIFFALAQTHRAPKLRKRPFPATLPAYHPDLHISANSPLFKVGSGAAPQIVP